MALEAERIIVEIEARTGGFDTNITSAARVNREAMSDIEKAATRAEGAIRVSGQNMAASANRSAGQIRAGYQQLSFQLNDVVTQLSSGTSITTIFAQQASQILQALQMIGSGGGSGGGAQAASSAIGGLNEQLDAAKSVAEGASGAATALSGALGGQAGAEGRAAAATTIATGATARDTLATEGNAAATTAATGAKAGFATFLAGPWGAAVIGAIALLGMFIGKLFDTEDQSTKTKDALDFQKMSLDQLREAIKKEADAARDGIQSSREAELQAVATATALQAETESRLRNAQSRLKDAILARQVQEDATTNAGLGEGALGAQFGVGMESSRVDRMQEQVAALEADVQASRAAAAARVIPLLRRQAEEASDPTARVRGDYDRAVQLATVQLNRDREAGRDMGRAQRAYINSLTAAARSRDAELERIQESTRHHRTPSDGVSRFRSRQGAIGVAGRELQGLGLRVGENQQFRGVHDNHTFAQHGLYAIDVNAPGSVVEANDPRYKAQFDRLARDYQARGYRVLWNGQIYEPGGDGPGRAIPARNSRGQGISPHLNHMHVEAPASIVGKPTQAGVAREESQEEREAARQEHERRQAAERWSNNQAQMTQELGRADQQLLAARRQTAQTAVERAQLEIDGIRVAQAQAEADARADAERRSREDPLHAVDYELQAFELGLRQQAIALVQTGQVREEERQQTQAQASQLERDALEDERDVLQIRADLAGTVSERRAAEQQLLDIAEDLVRKNLQTLAASSDIEQAARAQAQLARLPERRAAQQAALDRRFEPASQRYLRELNGSLSDVDSQLDQLDVQAMRALEDAIVDATTKALGLKGALGDIVGELIRIGLQRAVILPLANALFGSADGSGGGIFGSLFGSLLGGGHGIAAPAFKGAYVGFASGGSMMIGGAGGIDRNLLSLNGEPIAYVSRGERLDIVPQGATPAGPPRLNASGAAGVGTSVIRVELADDLNARIVSVSGQVAVQTVRSATPGIVRASTASTFREATRPRLGR